MRAPARIWQDAVSLPVTCRLSPCYMPSHSLFARTFSPVPTYIIDKGILFLAFFASFSFNIGIFFVYLHPQSARSAKTYCSIVSQSPREKSKLLLLGLYLNRAQLSHIKEWLVVSRETYGESLRLLRSNRNKH